MSALHDDPEAVRVQYSNEANLMARRSIYAEREGPDGPEAVFAAVAETKPRRVLEVGGGQGDLAERVVRELGCELVFIDQSARMVELARARGLDAHVGDVQTLAFADGSFDVAIAAWMLYHVPDLDRGIVELSRVLEPGGKLVAVTNGEHHLRELRDVFGVDFVSSFTRETGEELLRRHFSAVQRTDLDGHVTIRDREQVFAYRDSMMTSDKAHELVFDVPLRVRTASAIFVATK